MKPLETLLRTFVELHPEDAARAFETLNPEERNRLFKSMPSRLAAPVLERISPHTAAALMEQLSATQIGELLVSMPPRVASSIFQQFNETLHEGLLDDLVPEVARSIRQLSQYTGNTAGAMMDPKVVSLSIDLTTQQAISALRKASRSALSYLYVTQRDGQLVGVVTMRDLLLASPRDLVSEFVKHEVVSVPDTMPSEEVVQIMRERRFLAVPVVDFEGRLVGVVKHTEALQAGEQAAFDDLQKIVGAGADERALSPVSMVVRCRLPWLFINLVTAFMAAAVIGALEGLIANVAVLAVLLPVVAGQGGNTGSQSLAVVMRGLALREIIPGTKKRVITKELMGGVINGVAVAIGTGTAVFCWRLFAGDSNFACAGLALVIALAMIVNMAVAALAGAIIPMVLKACGRDPAQSAGIFLTTVTDIVGFTAFLGFATLFMSWIVS